MENQQPDKKTRLKSFNIDGTKYKTNLTSKFASRKMWTQPDDKKLLSYLPGNIAKIYVKPGQKVKKGEKVILFETMKMKTRINIHKHGIVKEIKVHEGERVTKGSVLLVLEEASA